MSRREFRPKRWEQKANVRPGKRARMFRYTQYDVDVSYERGIIRGTMDTAERSRRRDDLLFRLSQAAEQGGDALDELARELDQEADDDVTAVAREAGVLSDDEDKALWDSVPPALTDDPELLLAEVEQFLRDEG